MRSLKNKDLFLVGSMMKKAAPKLKELNFKAGTEESEDAHRKRVGVDVAIFLLTEFYDDFWAFLASIYEVSVEEFDDMPIGTSMDVIEHLASTEDFLDFLARAQKLAGLST